MLDEIFKLDDESLKNAKELIYLIFNIKINQSKYIKKLFNLILNELIVIIFYFKF